MRFILTTGDNIYAGRRVLGIAIGGTGDEDDDWFFTYFQPYRYVINRIPVYPSIGNHDADETEERDDRAQVEDNFYLRERIARRRGGRPRVVRPRPVLSVSLRLATSSSSASTRRRRTSSRGKRLFEYPKHWEFVEQSFPGERRRSPWRIPFAHHPLFSAGPQHHNTRGMERLLPLFERAGVRVMFTGHEHNFQHSRVDGFDHFVTGAAGKVRRTPPDRFIEAAHRVVGDRLPLPAGEDRAAIACGAGDRRDGRSPGTPVDITRFTSAPRTGDGPDRD